MTSLAEENYLKTIYALNQLQDGGASTNAIAEKQNTKASSVTDMLKKLSAKKLVNYEKYQAVNLTKEGRTIAIDVVRKHRLWEFFLVEKLKFKWDEVHDIAEQLEHIHSPSLVNRLDSFLNFPKYDPHGDPIPDKDGKIIHIHEKVLSDLKIGESARIVGVKEHSASFLNYLDTVKLVLGTPLKVLSRFEFDNSVVISINNEKEISISADISNNLYVKSE